MKLSDYTKITDNTERIHVFLDDNAEWMENYIDDCPDFLDGYADVLFESEIYLGELDDDDAALVQYLIDNNSLDELYNNCNIERTYGIHRVSNELASFGFGEQEVQFSGLSDDTTDCIYTEISKDIKPNELKEILDKSGQCVLNDCLYLDYSHDRASLILNVNGLIDDLLENINQ